MKKYSTVLSIAGSDSIGGAGIQADIKTCSALGVYAMTVITAITAQNSSGVRQVSSCSPYLLREQLRAVLDDVKPDAVKIGMIPNHISAEIIAEELQKYNLSNIVLDPLLVATSGDSLSDDGTLSVILKELFSIASVVTPNIPEAATILERKISSVDDMLTATHDIYSRYNPTAVLLKGGHLTNTNTLTDILHYDKTDTKFSTKRINTDNTHGTGCSLSSAIAAYLALGFNITDAVEAANHWLHKAIDAGKDYTFGHGHGPVNHIFKSIQS
jgi:hydroxymethylpyrimidine/phosphomethylpyrimidine kinase